MDKTFTKVNSQWLPVQISQYARHMRRWLEHFPVAQILVVEFSEMTKEPQRQLQRVEMFLGLRPFIDQTMRFYFDSFKKCMRWRRSKMSKGRCLGTNNSQEQMHHVNRKALIALRKYFAPSNLQFFGQTGVNYSWPLE